MYLRLFETLALLFVVYAIVSQVLIPAARGTRLLPWFRRERKILDDIADANQDIRERDLEDVLKQRRDAGLDTQPGEVETPLPEVPVAEVPATNNASRKDAQ